MIYDVEKVYSVKELEALSGDELLKLYESAKQVSWGLQGIKKIKKAQSDIATMRYILKGFNQVHNQNGIK